MIGMKIGKWTENLGALATRGVTAAGRDTDKARSFFAARTPTGVLETLASFVKLLVPLVGE
jgi:hypothetical protein